MKSKLDPFEQAVHRAHQGKHWRRQEAIVVLERWRGSGMTVADFIRAHQLPPKRVGWWKRRLKDDLEVEDQREEPQFVELQLAPQAIEPAPTTAATARPLTPPTLEVVLRGHRAVRVTEGFDAVTLARVVEVLEALPC